MLEENHIRTLRESLLFRDLAAPMFDDFVSRGAVCRLDRGATLFLQGDPAESIYVVLDGLMKLGRITQSGDDIVVAV